MKSFLRIIAACLISSTLAIFGYEYFSEPRKVIIRETSGTPLFTNGETVSEVPTNYKRSWVSSAPTDFIGAAEASTPAVVNIKALESAGLSSWFEQGSYGSSSGSGVIISEDGYIVTNNHVIEDGDQYEVTLNDKREYKATLIGKDTNTDLALLKIESDDPLPTVRIGNSDSLQVGEWVLAVGNPFNLESTVTAGIVSAKGRSIDILEGEYRIESFIQTDAAVNPGNSGGALVNTNGELIGINTAIITRSGRYEGYSFAVPSNLVQKIIWDLREHGIVQRGMLGVGIGEVTNARAKQLGLEKVEGVYITRVTPTSGADEGGLRKGDVIMAINGVKTSAVPSLQEIVGRFRPGNVLRVEYIRNGKLYKTNVTLKNRFNKVANEVKEESDLAKEAGFELRNLSSDEKRRLRTEGVFVVSVFRNTKIERTEMDPGYIITKINDVRVNTVSDALAELRKSEGKVLLEGFYENYPGEYYYTFKK